MRLRHTHSRRGPNSTWHGRRAHHFFTLRLDNYHYVDFCQGAGAHRNPGCRPYRCAPIRILPAPSGGAGRRWTIGLQGIFRRVNRKLTEHSIDIMMRTSKAGSSPRKAGPYQYLCFFRNLRSANWGIVTENASGPYSSNQKICLPVPFFAASARSLRLNRFSSA
jgi:hypothetical protein